MPATQQPGRAAAALRGGRVTDTRLAVPDPAPDADDPLNARGVDAGVHRQCLRRPQRSGLHSKARARAQCSDRQNGQTTLHARPATFSVAFQEGSIQTHHDPFSKI
jgi:hypothetical protein